MRSIYVDNLPPRVTEDQLYALFAHYGAVERVLMVAGRDEPITPDFAFVEMEDEGADEAIRGLDGVRMEGQELHVSEA